MNTLAIFQRTADGRTEIQTKMYGLTQSERLALIVVDGSTPYCELRKKLKGLTDDRFDRALNSLAKNNLIFEVLEPIQNIDSDNFDSATVERFLRQEPMDPVTIISFDAKNESESDLIKKAARNAALPKSQVPTPPIVPVDVDDDLSSMQAAATPRKIANVDFYIPLQKTRPANKNPTLSNVQGAGRKPRDATNSTGSLSDAEFLLAKRRRQGSFLLLAIGMVVIVMFMLVKFAY